MLILAAAEAAKHTNYTAIGEVLTAMAAVGTLAWGVLKDRKQQREQHQTHEDTMTATYLKRSLDAFDELVRSLQNEVERLTRQRDDSDKAAREREIALTREIGRLRVEVRLLREELNKNGIMVPDFGVFQQMLDELPKQAPPAP